jgi:UDP-N-acetylglucosamine--N-acetylmuramyl-(pentapeptide) pyrophosphoryl-undecaprenol N-acetylglucosamine transferase
MRILVAGGGSGGHVTPVLAVLEELKKQHPTLKICFVCDQKFAPQARTIIAQSNLQIELRTVFAGKLRRYHGVSLAKQLLDIPTVLQNIRDIFLLAIGFVQSIFLVLRFRPQVVFTKGGFVCLPVGYASALLRKPLVIHDSDAHPGLTNRLLARWATAIGTGAPLENYPYDPAKSHYVGIPVATAFHPATVAEHGAAHGEVMVDPKRLLIVATGGGLGAVRLNTAIARIADQLIDMNAEIIHVTGAANAAEVESFVDEQLTSEQRPYYHIEPFVDGAAMAVLVQGADIVISRGGATTLAELAAAQKACVLLPNPLLTGGHQLKNAKVLADAKAAIVLDEKQVANDPSVLLKAVGTLVQKETIRQQLSRHIAQFAKPNAANDMAAILSEQMKGRQ